MSYATVAVVMMPPVAVALVLVLVVMVMVMTMMFLPAGIFHVLQLQVHHVLLLPGAAVVGNLVAVQVLVTEPVTAERFGGQVVPRLDRFDYAVLAPIRGRRLRLDRVLP